MDLRERFSYFSISQTADQATAMWKSGELWSCTLKPFFFLLGV